MTDRDTEGPRGCEKQELGELIDMADLVFRPDGAQTLLTDYPLVYADANLPNVQMLKSDGKIVSVVPFIVWPVAFKGCRFRIGIISATATHPNHRHRGYGLRCLNRSIAEMERQDVDLSILWTMVPTFDFYNHAAYQGVRDQGHTYSCTRADASRFEDHGHEVVRFEAASGRMLDDLHAIHGIAGFALVRDRDQTASLFSLPRLTTHVAMHGGVPAAYLCHSTSSNKTGLIEAAGEKAALETLLHRSLSEVAADASLPAHTQLSKTVFVELLAEKLGEPRQGSGENTMVRVNDVGGFLRRIGGWLQRKNADHTTSLSIEITDADETVSLDIIPDRVEIAAERRKVHFEMTRLELTSTIFGPHPARPYEPPEPLARLFPFYFPITVLDRS